MGVVRCPNGHFYDNEKFGNCPHCDHQSAFQRNHAYADVDAAGKSDAVAFPEVRFAPPVDIPAAVTAKPQPQEDQDVTVAVMMYDEIEPAVGWTVILDGKRRGTDYTLHAGVNVLTDYCETPEERSVKIVYDPRGNQYLLEADNTAMRILLNGKQVTEKLTPLSGSSRLICGETEFMLVLLCDGDFQWKDD